ncbi:MAG: MBL fold metallo-hydrolase [Candidatus Bathyarchaeota archaeon]|nr:MBL fold metallo-hydrolase [Candidatus Bathyarchaeota archaeon]
MVEVLKGVHTIDLSETGRLSLECYLLDCPEGVVLVDTGMQESAVKKIGAELDSMGRSWRDIEAILITHKHGDHIRNLPRVKELTGAEVMAHKGDAKDIEESTKVEVKGLEHGDRLPYCGGIEVIHVPGHSAGNCCYYLPGKKLVIAGDTVFGDEEGNLEAPPERYCLDVKQASREIRRLMEYDFDALLITHGKNTMQGAKEKVEKLCK